MRTSAAFKIAVPTLVGLLLGILVLFLTIIPPKNPSSLFWRTYGQIDFVANSPARFLFSVWQASFPPDNGDPLPMGRLVCVIMGQWLLIGAIAGVGWAYFKRAHEKHPA
jgi:hypothetical protein